MRGANVIAVDVDGEKLKVARDIGATTVINAKEEDPVKRVMEITTGKGADVTIEAAGRVDTTKNALDSVRTGGRVVLQGLCETPVSYDTRLLVRKEVSVLASFYSINAGVSIFITLLKIQC